MPNPQLPDAFRPQATAYQGDDVGGVLRTDVAGGAARYGLDWARGTQRFAVALVLTPLQLAVWNAFYHHVIAKGAINFDMWLDSGFGPALHACNIVPGTCNTTRTGGQITTVTFTAEAEPQAYELSAEEGASLVDIYALYRDDSDDLLNILARFANVDSLVLDF